MRVPLEHRSSNFSRIILAAGVVCFGLSNAAYAQIQPAGSDPCPIPVHLTKTRPDPEGSPTRISLNIYIIELKDIDDVSQTFTAHFVADAKWSDPRLSLENLGVRLDECRLDVSSIWTPRIAFINGQNFETLRNDFESITADGEVRYIQRHRGQFSGIFDLRQFPLDRQNLAIHVGAGGYTPEQVTFEVPEGGPGVVDSQMVPGWTIESGHSVTDSLFVPQLGIYASHASFSVTAVRRTGFFLWKVIVPLGLIVAMSWTVFWINPDDLESQIALSSAAVITLIAFQLSLGYLVPKISYLTRLDLYVLGSTVLVFAALAEGIVTARMAASGRHRAAKIVDRVSRWAFAGIFLGIIGVAFLV